MIADRDGVVARRGGFEKLVHLVDGRRPGNISERVAAWQIDAECKAGHTPALLRRVTEEAAQAAAQSMQGAAAPPALSFASQVCVDLADGHVAERSNPRRQRRKEQAHALFARRDCHRRETALDSHVLRERPQLASEPRRLIIVWQQSTDAAQPVLSKPSEQPGSILRWPPPIAQPDASAEQLLSCVELMLPTWL